MDVELFIVKRLGLISGESLVSSCSVLNSAPSTTHFSATEETNIPAGLYFSQNLVVMTFIYWQVMEIAPLGQRKKAE